MFNYVTGHNYSGQNVEILSGLGYDEDDGFVTFKQAIKLDGVSGKLLKGIKSDASLIRLVMKTVIDEDTGREVTKKVPVYFSVFHINKVFAHVRAAKEAA